MVNYITLYNYRFLEGYQKGITAGLVLFGSLMRHLGEVLRRTNLGSSLSVRSHMRRDLGEK